MKIKVQRSSIANEQLMFDTLTNTRELISKQNNTPSKGIYDIIENIFLLLYKSDKGELHLVINNRNIPVDKSFAIAYKQASFSKRGVLTVFHKHIEYIISYDISDMQPVSTIFWSETEEDVNFGLWLSLVLNSNERKQILISNW